MTRMPPTRPPRWPPIEMFPNVNVKTRFRTTIEGSAAEDVHVMAFDNKRGAEDPEHGSRGSDRRCVRGHEQRPCRAGERGHEVEPEEPPVTEVALEYAAEPPERQHVEREMEEARVEKGARDEPVPFALRDERAEQGSALEDLTADVLDAAPGGDLGQVDDDVDRDQRDGDRAGRQPCFRGFGPGSRRASARCHARALGAADADRPEDHAVRADRAVAVGAADSRLDAGAGSRPCAPWFPAEPCGSS